MPAFPTRNLRQVFSQIFCRFPRSGRLISVAPKSSQMSGKSSDLSDMMSEYIDVGKEKVETHVIKFGSLPTQNGSIQSQNGAIPTQNGSTSTQNGSIPPQNGYRGQQYLFLIIPGNPGIPEYYEEFMHTLWEKSKRKIPVWCVGHSGHVTGPKHPVMGWSGIVQKPQDVYSLEGQISNKVNFIHENIPTNVKLILIGHSIGCYMIMNMLPRIPQFKVLRSFMLFPTIERMAETSNGRVFTPTLNYCRWFVVGMVKALSYLGCGVHRKIVEYHFLGQQVPECAVQASHNLFNPTCFNHITYMGKLEMGAVRERQEDLLAQHVDKMSFYYGSADGWCPREYCYAMQERYPQADIRICQMDFSHAFVLDAGEPMAHAVWDWVLHHL